MSKSYIVNCYTCQHNGQETCKGCNTLLNGENEPYENWQLREDLETKDKQIAELKNQLNNSEQACLICHKDQENEQFKQQIEKLEKLVAEKEKELKNVQNPFEPNKKFIIAELEKVKNYVYQQIEEIKKEK